MEFVIHASKSISLMFLKFGSQKKNSSLNANQPIERLCSRSCRRNSEHLHLQDAQRIKPPVVEDRASRFGLASKQGRADSRAISSKQESPATWTPFGLDCKRLSLNCNDSPARSQGQPTHRRGLKQHATGARQPTTAQAIERLYYCLCRRCALP